MKNINEKLNQYLRLSTFSLGIKMLRKAEEVPEKTRQPKRDMGHRLAICQAVGMARRIGWSLALGREDIACPLAQVAMGFEKPIEYYTCGSLCKGMYTETLEAGATTEKAVDKFAPGQYGYLYIAPIERATLEPDLLVIYGNSAQVMRLVQAALYKRGGTLTSSFSGRMDCADIIVTTLKMESCQVVLPCNGDRVFGHAEDGEMAFTIPWHMVEEVLYGLEQTHKAGVRYPIPAFLQYEPKFPPSYEELERRWEKKGQD